jgi:hypothetical protein
MKVLTATLALLLSSPAAAQECKSCSEADACLQTYLKGSSEAQRATKVAIRDWQQGLRRILQQGHGCITKRPGFASSFGSSE